MNKLLQRFVMLAFFWVFAFGIAEAQRTVSGTVTDDSGEPMIGVNILAIGSSVGTVSDFDGGFKLDVPAGTTQLQFSYTGYNTVVMDLGSSSQLSVVMGEGAILEDVVVTGYGTVKRENVTGAISTVKEEDFNRGAITSAQELIVGKVAGVNVVTSGEPGAGAVIRIRGGSSLTATNDPLIIIDGIPVSGDQISGSRNSLNVVNPNDIETFTVLKDASATAIYGSRASNGVIIITTKKGSLADKFGVEYTGTVGFSDITKRASVLSPGAFRSYIEGHYPEGSAARNLLGDAETDWQDQIYQQGFSHDHTLALTGHVGEIPYRLSGGYSDKDGLLKTDNFNRTTAALNLSPKFFDNKLQLNLSGKYMIDKNHFADQGAIGAAAFFDPTQPVYADGGNPYGNYFTWLNADGTPSLLSPDNPLALLEQTDANSTVNRYILGAQIDYRFWFLENLRANLNLGYDKSEGEGTKFIDTTAAFAYNTLGISEAYHQENKNELLEFYLDYADGLGSNIDMDLMAGYSWQHFYKSNDFVATRAYPQEGVSSDTLTPYDVNPREYYLLSLFGRANFTFYDDFLLTFTLRRDGSSRFSEDTRWGTFPGAAIAWKMMDGTDATDTELKLRLGWGITGQQGIGDDNFYPYLPRYLASTPTAQYQFGNEYVTTFRPQPYDAEIKWEETTTYNVGVDYGFYDNRVFGALDFYVRETKDLINKVPVAAGTNLSNYIITNVGNLSNKGVEASLNVVPWRKGNKEWSFGVNGAFNENEITKLTVTDDPNYNGVATGGIAGGVGNTVQIQSVGYPSNSFYVYNQVYDAAGIPIENLYVDVNGDGVVNNNDFVQYKKAAADVTLGLYTTLDLGRFDIAAGARASIGNYVYNNNLVSQGNAGFIYNSSGGVDGGYLNNIDVRTEEIDFSSPQYFSDFYVQDASFFKIDHITAGYDLITNGKGIENLRIFATAQNPVVITNYEGIDPEIAVRDINGNVTTGIDNNLYPRSQTFLFGINVRF